MAKIGLMVLAVVFMLTVSGYSVEHRGNYLEKSRQISYDVMDYEKDVEINNVKKEKIKYKIKGKSVCRNITEPPTTSTPIPFTTEPPTVSEQVKIERTAEYTNIVLFKHKNGTYIAEELNFTLIATTVENILKAIVENGTEMSLNWINGGLYWSLSCKLKLVQQFNETNVQGIIEAALNPSVILYAIESGRRQIKAAATETLPYYIQTIVDPLGIHIAENMLAVPLINVSGTSSQEAAKISCNGYSGDNETYFNCYLRKVEIQNDGQVEEIGPWKYVSFYLAGITLNTTSDLSQLRQVNIQRTVEYFNIVYLKHKNNSYYPITEELNLTLITTTVENILKAIVENGTELSLNWNNYGWVLSLSCKLKLVQQFNETNVQNVIQAALNPSIIINAIETGRNLINKSATETINIEALSSISFNENMLAVPLINVSGNSFQEATKIYCYGYGYNYNYGTSFSCYLRKAEIYTDGFIEEIGRRQHINFYVNVPSSSTTNDYSQILTTLITN